MPTTWRQDNFRFRNDDGSQTGATWIDAVDTNVSISVYYGDVKFRVRISVTEQGSTPAALTSPNLYVSKNGAAYTQILTSRTDVKPSSSSYVTDGTATTQQIDSVTFVAGTVDTVDGKCATTATITPRYAGTELEYNLIALSAGLSNGDYFDFRVYTNTTALNTYSSTGRVTFTKTPPSFTLSISDSAQTQTAGDITFPSHQFLEMQNSVQDHFSYYGTSLSPSVDNFVVDDWSLSGAASIQSASILSIGAGTGTALFNTPHTLSISSIIALRFAVSEPVDSVSLSLGYEDPNIRYAPSILDNLWHTISYNMVVPNGLAGYTQSFSILGGTDGYPDYAIIENLKVFLVNPIVITAHNPTGYQLTVQNGQHLQSSENPTIVYHEHVINPADFPGLVMWHEADHIAGLSDGSSVTSWVDSGTNNYPAVTRNGNPVYKTNIKNGLPVVRFSSASSQDLQVSNSGALDAWRNKGYGALFAVIKPTSATAKGDVMFVEDGTNGVGRLGFAASETGHVGVFTLFGRRLDSNSAQFVSGSTAIVAGNWYIVSCLVEWANAKAVIRVNGIEDGRSDSFQTAGNTSDTRSWSIEYASSGGASWFSGDIAEAIWYNQQITSASAAQIETYLNNKWNVYTASTSLTVQNSSQIQTSDSVSLTSHNPSYTLTTQNTLQPQTVDAISLIQHQKLIAQDASKLQTSGSVSLVQHQKLSGQDASHTQTSGSLALIQHQKILGQDSSQLQASGSILLLQHQKLGAQDSTQLQTSGSISLLQHQILSLQNATQAQTSDGITVTGHIPGSSLTISNGLQIVVSDSLSLLQHQKLIGQDSSQLQTSGSLSLTQHQKLTGQNASQLQTSGSLLLTQHQKLTAQDSSQLQTSGNVLLVQHQKLILQDASQLQNSQNVSLVQHQRLTTQDDSQLQTSGSLALVQHQKAILSDASQLQTSDSIVVTGHIPGGAISVSNASQLFTSDNISIVQHQKIVVQDANQPQTAGGVSLVQHQAASITNTIQTQTSEGITVVYHSPSGVTLSVSNSAQAQTAGNVTITFHIPIWTLGISNAIQTTGSDGLNIVYHSPAPIGLNVSNSTQPQTANNISLVARIPSWILSIGNNNQSHVADSLIVIAHVPSASLIIQNDTHIQISTSANLTQHFVLSVWNGVQSLTSENIDFAQHYHYYLVIEDGEQIQDTSSPFVKASNVLAIDSAIQKQESDNITLLAVIDIAIFKTYVLTNIQAPVYLNKSTDSDDSKTFVITGLSATSWVKTQEEISSFVIYLSDGNSSV